MTRTSFCLSGKKRQKNNEQVRVQSCRIHSHDAAGLILIDVTVAWPYDASFSPF